MPAGTQFSAQAHPEGLEQGLESISPFAEDKAGAPFHHAHALRGHGIGRGFPVPAEIGEVALPRGCIFFQNLIFPVAVNPDRRGIDEHQGALHAGELRQAAGDADGYPDPALP